MDADIDVDVGVDVDVDSLARVGLVACRDCPVLERGLCSNALSAGAWGGGRVRLRLLRQAPAVQPE